MGSVQRIGSKLISEISDFWIIGTMNRLFTTFVRDFLGISLGTLFFTLIAIITGVWLCSYYIKNKKAKTK